MWQIKVLNCTSCHKAQSDTRMLRRICNHSSDLSNGFSARDYDRDICSYVILNNYKSSHASVSSSLRRYDQLHIPHGVAIFLNILKIFIRYYLCQL